MLCKVKTYTIEDLRTYLICHSEKLVILLKIKVTIRNYGQGVVVHETNITIYISIVIRGCLYTLTPF